MSARLLMIALDGADSERLERWSDDGRLPNLARLRQRGITRSLATPFGASDDSLWASFQYGIDESTHGRVFRRGALSSGRMGDNILDEANRDAFWHRLSAEGMRVAVLDVPKSPQPRAINGIHLADWLVHGKYHKQPQSHPPSLADEVLARFGPPPPSMCGHFQEAPTDLWVSQFIGNLRASIAQKLAAALHYLTAEPWDLFVVGFKEGHCSGHGLWNFVDRDHPEFDEARSLRLAWPVEQIFQGLDSAIGDLIAGAGPEAEVVVFTTTRMEPTGSIDHLMPQVVLRLNAALSGRPAPWLDQAYERLKLSLPGRPAGWLTRAWGRLHRGMPVPGPVTQLRGSDNCGALRLNAGESSDPQNRVRLLREIGNLLTELVDEETGAPVATKITYPSTQHEGPRAASLPDILMHYRSALVPRTIRSARLGRIGGRRRRRRPGNHAVGGLAIVDGPISTSCGAELTRLEDFTALACRVLEVLPNPIVDPMPHRLNHGPSEIGPGEDRGVILWQSSTLAE